MDNAVKKILIDLVDDPQVPMRTQVDDSALEDLAESIRTNGLIQPIILKEKNGRFEVVAGHRRLRAHRLLKLTHIEAIIKEYSDEQAESAKVHENLFREDVNPVDQAVFLARYIERTKSDLPAVARMLNRTPEWVEGRLQILKYPDYLVDEVYNGKISLGVASWLAQIPSEATRQEYTRFAALQGINIKTARRWFELAAAGTLPENPTQMVEVHDLQGGVTNVPMVKCVFCWALEEIGKLETDFVHAACRLEYQQEFERSLPTRSVPDPAA